jgi:hypothetical protein
MKQIFNLLLLMIISVSFTSLVSCSSDDEPNYAVKLQSVDTLNVSDTVSLKFTVTPTKHPQAVWTSSNTDVATIDASTGKVEAVGGGSSIVTVTIGNAKDSCVVTVNPDVYVAGYENNASYNAVATVWKNGKAIRMEADTTFTSSAQGVYVSGKDVYVAGYVNNANYISTATVWKNGKVLYTLGDGTKNTKATSVVVKDGVVYAAGQAFDADGKGRATVWKNGTATYLVGNNKDNETQIAALAPAICVEGNDVYVAGYEVTGFGINAAMVWKNGVATAYTDGTTLTKVSSIFSGNGDIYVAGCAVDNNYVSTAEFWKNGKATTLSDGSVTWEANSVWVDGNDVYIAGGHWNAATSTASALYWKNGKATDLTDGTHSSYGQAIAVKNGNVYVAGTELNDSYNNVVKVWKNGKATSYSDGKYYTYVYSMFLK